MSCGTIDGKGSIEEVEKLFPYRRGNPKIQGVEMGRKQVIIIMIIII